MNLPDFLTRDECGFISFAGHRIGLHHVLRLYKEGQSVQQIAEEFPTLPREVIDRTIVFYTANRPDVEAYLAEEEAAYERQVTAHPPSPALLEIRRRLAAKGIRTEE